MRVIRIVALLAILLAQAAAAGFLDVSVASERVVEGHTVYLALGAADDPVASEFRPAHAPDPGVGVFELRKPGVLWFNHEYLVAPQILLDAGDDVPDGHALESAAAVAILAVHPDGSYPCGGAILAVNAGDPDPRQALVHADGATLGGHALPVVTDDYEESYLVSDPNGHSWIIDKYTRITRTTTAWDPASLGLVLTVQETVHAGPVFVVNLGGGRDFAPDAGACIDIGTRGLDQARSAPCSVGLPSLPGTVLTDAPCAGAMPRNAGGFCYEGPGAGSDAACREAALAVGPRLYNALLFLPMESLVWEGAPVDHATPSGATNGCAVGTRWTCPAGDEEREGDSHGFAPLPMPLAYSSCLDGGINHGGFAAEPGWCTPRHETRGIDVYYSAQARPPPPQQYNFVVFDTKGTGAGAGP